MVRRAEGEEKCGILGVRGENVIRDSTSQRRERRILQLILDVKKVGGISAA